jgi:diguanylate cyclase (GGDEF)-like protein
MDPAKRAELDKKLTQLREFYIQGLPAEFEKLQRLLDEVNPNKPAREVISEIHQALHKFAGSGGSFGFHELSADARKAEQELLKWLKTEESLFSEEKLADLRSKIDELKKVLVSKEHQDQTPRETEVTQSRPNVDTKEHSQAKQNNIIKSKRILLVEDNKKLHEKLARELVSFSFEVIPFASLDLLKIQKNDNKADLLLIDLSLLNYDQTKNSLLLPPIIKEQGVPFLLIGAQNDFNIRLAIAKLGASGYFVMPLDIADIIQRINQVFDAQSALPGRVLIVDDDLQLACHYKLVLEAAEFKVDFVTHPEELLPRMESFQPELVLMDLNMPDVSGRDLAGVIRQFKRYNSLPIVFLSAETELSAQIDALYYGADEFLTKPISDDALILAVHARISRARTLEALITKDGLTGLLTHSNIKEMAGYELSRAKRTAITQCFAMLDIDHFKSVNDTYGHATGDTVIASLATLLKQRLRTTDLIGRYGGEEFLVVLPECEIDEAVILLEKIRVLFSEIEFCKDDMLFSSSISIGVASTSQFLSCEADDLINCADQALYRAKRSGRNKTVMYAAAD